MAISCRPANPNDLPRLMDLMTDFYRESGYRLDQRRSKIAFAAILEEPSLGLVWILEKDGRSVGYMVLTLGFSMEYGGRDAFLDDLFIHRDHRGVGLGKAALKTLLHACRDLDVRAVHLEVERTNAAAKTLYSKFGFKNNQRQLLTCRLKNPL